MDFPDDDYWEAPMDDQATLPDVSPLQTPPQPTTPRLTLHDAIPRVMHYSATHALIPLTLNCEESTNGWVGPVQCGESLGQSVVVGE